MNIHPSHDPAWRPKYHYILIIALVTTFLTSNILAYKYVGLLGLRFGASAVLFPFSLVVGDALSEVYGFKRARNATLISLACYFYFMVMSHITVMLPPAPEWTMQAEYEKFFSSTFRVFLACSAAFLTSELVNAYVLVKIKALMKGRSFYIRALAAAILGEIAHTLVVAPILFGFILTSHQLLQLILTATGIKIAVQILVLPLTYLVVFQFKKREGIDYYG